MEILDFSKNWAVIHIYKYYDMQKKNDLCKEMSFYFICHDQRTLLGYPLSRLDRTSKTDTTDVVPIFIAEVNNVIVVSCNV